MAKKKAQASDPTEIADKLIADINEDRERLSKFFDKLLAVEEVHAIAEPVARIADSLTKQIALRVATLKAQQKAAPTGEKSEDAAYEEIGRPFEPEQDGSN